MLTTSIEILGSFRGRELLWNLKYALSPSCSTTPAAVPRRDNAAAFSRHLLKIRFIIQWTHVLRAYSGLSKCHFYTTYYNNLSIQSFRRTQCSLKTKKSGNHAHLQMFLSVEYYEDYLGIITKSGFKNLMCMCSVTKWVLPL